MKLNQDNSYVFLNGNKHGLIKWESKDSMLAEEFTILAKFTPDYDKMDELLDDKDVVQQVVLGRNGKHMGLCFIGYKASFDGVSKKYYKVSYEWWQNPEWEKTQDPSLDQPKDVFIDNLERGTTFKVHVQKKDNKFFIDVNGQTSSNEYDSIIDYSDCLCWIGCGNKTFLDPEDIRLHGCIYHGDISMLHIQDGLLLNKDIDLFYEDIDLFLAYNGSREDNVVYFSSDFKDTTAYKVMDKSANGNHPMLFSKEWLD